MIQEQAYGRFSESVFLREGPLPSLIKAHFEITYRCNLRCVHCYTDPFNNAGDLSRELTVEGIIRILDELAAAGVLWLTLSGGEALTHPRFQEIYKAARARGFLISLLSNATLITDSVISFLRDDPPFQLEVSMHGASAVVYNQVTQVSGSYERFREGIEKILRAGLPLRLKTNALTLNRQELPAIKTFVESLGLTFSLDSSIHPRLNGDTSSTAYRLSAEKILRLEYGDSERPRDGCLARPNGDAGVGPTDNRLFRCGCGTTSVTINPYGILRACTFTTWPSYDLRSVSVGEAFQQLSAAIRAAVYTGESPCRICPATAYCDKNPITAGYEVGSMQAPVPHFCELAYGRRAQEEMSV